MSGSRNSAMRRAYRKLSPDALEGASTYTKFGKDKVLVRTFFNPEANRWAWFKRTFGRDKPQLDYDAHRCEVKRQARIGRDKLGHVTLRRRRKETRAARLLRTSPQYRSEHQGVTRSISQCLI